VRRLKRTGRLRMTVRVTFTPAGGEAATRTRVVTLIRR